MIALFTLSIIIFCIGAIMLFVGFSDVHKSFHTAVGGALITLSIVIFIAPSGNTPNAIDVYRGNTTLKITYKDGVPTDSVVVFKDKE